MPVWNIAPVNERPSVTLRRWSVREVALDGPTEPWTRHLVGWAVEDQQGQVSSAVAEFDPQTRCARTRSGRVYELAQEPGHQADAEYVWSWWKANAQLRDERDVTAQVYAEIMAAARPPEGG